MKAELERSGAQNREFEMRISQMIQDKDNIQNEIRACKEQLKNELDEKKNLNAKIVTLEEGICFEKAQIKEKCDEIELKDKKINVIRKELADEQESKNRTISKLI